MARSSVSHMARSTVSVLVALVLSLTHSPPFTWGAKAHEIIAYIAEVHLSKSAQNKIKKYCRKMTPSFRHLYGRIEKDEKSGSLRRFITWMFRGAQIPTTARETAPAVTVSLKPLPGICTFLPWMMHH